MGNYFNELRWKIIRANNLNSLYCRMPHQGKCIRSLYEANFLKMAVDTVRNGVMSVWEAAENFSVPRTMIQDRHSWTQALGNKLLYLKWQKTNLLLALSKQQNGSWAIEKTNNIQSGTAHHIHEIKKAI